MDRKDIDRNRDKRKGIQWIRSVFMAVFLAICVVGTCMCAGAGMVCEAKTDEKAVKEVEAFTAAFYEAHTKEKIDTLEEYIEDKESVPEYLLEYEVSFSWGVSGYDNIDVLAYPLDDGEYWVAFVCSDMIVEYFDIGLPGLTAMMVHREQDGSMFIVLNAGTIEEDFEEFAEKIQEMALRDEVVEKAMEINARFDEILDENQDIAEWSMLLRDDIYAIKAGTYTETNPRSELYANSNAGNELYIVKEGDCLWNIAEDELGDGMYWTKIYRENQSVIGDNPDLLFVGIEIRVEE